MGVDPEVHAHERLPTVRRWAALSAGPVLVFQHAWLGSLRICDGVVPHLRDRYRCRPGHAGVRPEQQQPGRPEPTQDANDVLELSTQLGIDRFTLIGRNSGGFLSTYVALKVPERVATRAVSSAPTIDFIPAEMVPGLIGAGKRWLPAIAKSPQACSHGSIQPLSMLASTRHSPTVRRTHEKRLSACEAHNYDRLAKITMPTLTVTGSDDLLLGAAIRTMQELPNASVHILGRVCHMPPLEVPEAQAAVIDDFVHIREAPRSGLGASP